MALGLFFLETRESGIKGLPPFPNLSCFPKCIALLAPPPWPFPLPQLSARPRSNCSPIHPKSPGVKNSPAERTALSHLDIFLEDSVTVGAPWGQGSPHLCLWTSPSVTVNQGLPSPPQRLLSSWEGFNDLSLKHDLSTCKVSCVVITSHSTAEISPPNYRLVANPKYYWKVVVWGVHQK